MGKGSTRRPAQVPDKTVRRNWERTFKRPRGWYDTDPDGVVDTESGLTFYVPKHERYEKGYPKPPEDGAYGMSELEADLPRQRAYNAAMHEALAELLKTHYLEKLPVRGIVDGPPISPEEGGQT